MITTNEIELTIKEEVREFLRGCNYTQVTKIFLYRIHNITDIFNKNKELSYIYHKEFNEQARDMIINNFGWIGND